MIAALTRGETVRDLERELRRYMGRGEAQLVIRRAKELAAVGPKGAAE